jgi:hypothetical protein
MTWGIHVALQKMFLLNGTFTFLKKKSRFCRKMDGPGDHHIE